jgi:DnaJ like chaperone protein
MTCRIIATILGLFFGGPLGGIIGFFVGSFLDQSVNKTQRFSGFQWRQMFAQPFIRGVFVLMGYLAKADGRVTPNEISIASHTMTQLRLTDEQRQQAMRWFYDGKNGQFKPEDIFQKLSIYRQTPLMKVLLACLMNMAHANGAPSIEQRKILTEICEKLGVAAPESQQQSHHYQYNNHYQNTSQRMNTLSEDYNLLSLKSDADIATIRKTYRRLMNKFHPDKIASKGANEKELKAANEKIYKIRQAYENIMRSKGENV